MLKSVFTIFLLALTLSLPASARTYKLAVVATGWPGYSAAQIAHSKHFWQQYGLDVQLILYTRISDYVNAIVNKRADFCFIPLPSMVDFRKNGNELVYLGTTMISKPGDSIVLVKKELVNKSLKGQVVGIPGNESFGKTIIANYLRKHNNQLADVRLVYMSAEQLSKNFIQGRLKAIYTYGPSVGKTINQGNGVLVDAASTQFGLAADKDTLEQIKKTDIRNLQLGILLANQWINEPNNREEYLRIINQKFFKHLAEFSSSEINLMLDKLRFLEPQEVITHNRNDLPIVFNRVKQIFAEEGSLKGPALEHFSLPEVVLNHSLFEAANELKK